MYSTRYSCHISIVDKPPDHFSEKRSNFMKIRLVRAEFSQEEGQSDRQTDMTKLIVAFHNFAEN